MKLTQNQRYSFGRRDGDEKPYFQKRNKLMPFDRCYPTYSTSNRGYYPYYHSGGNFATFTSNPTPWACDYCHQATFRTYEEAIEHEKHCHMNHRAQTGAENFRTPTRQRKTSTESKEKEVSRKRRCDLKSSHIEKDGLLLAMPNDHESLSNRQCYVRSQFVELFTATEADVASRHSKGAQKLHVGQQGLRCRFCRALPMGERTERSVCYPSSISRIYQTVADMQRFHFEQCTEIPIAMKKTYKSLRTTRPRGVGSPQQYWISSAQELGLVDSDQGIRLGPALDDRHSPTNIVPSLNSPSHYSPNSTNSCSRDPSPETPRSKNPPKDSSLLIPLSPESNAEESQASTVESPVPIVTDTISQPQQHDAVPLTSTEVSQEEEKDDGIDVRRSDASILLALRNTQVKAKN